MGQTATESALMRRIADRREALLEDLRLHVGLPTGGGNRAALDEERGLLCERLARLGAKVELVPGAPADEWLTGPGVVPPPTAVCSRPRGGAACRVLLAGHLDTVHDPAGPFRDLTVSPDGLRATGPGCVDMKGGLVIAVAALEALEEAGLGVSWTFVLNSDEETGSYHSAATLEEEALRHDVGLVFEPAMADGGLVVERAGSGQFLIEVEGRAAHVGRDFASGVSAVVALAERILRCHALVDIPSGVVVNVAPISGGVAPNVVPDRARGLGNVRFRTPAQADRLARELDALATPGDALPRVRVRRSFTRPAKPLTDATRALAVLVTRASEDLGRPLPWGSTGGVCDGNNLQARGLPTLDTLGVRGGGLHTPGEWIEVPSLVERCQLAALVLHRLATGGVPAPLPDPAQQDSR